MKIIVQNYADETIAQIAKICWKLEEEHTNYFLSSWIPELKIKYPKIFS